jgi:GNAT superfamily N-acetyltransferase
MIEYMYNADRIEPHQLEGFFVGWPNPPSPETHLRLLQNSDRVVLAMDKTNDKVVGFITAVTDGVLSSYIPLLEVLPDYQKQGIGAALIARMLEQLKDFYMVDLLCDADLQPFYEKLGMRRATGMFIRNYDRQSGEG